jgi:taurine dioxygenase
MLHAQELPAEGGDTIFANLYLAYETLPPKVKRRIAGKRAIHDYQLKYHALVETNRVRPPLSEDQKRKVQASVHPIVRTHPETGRQSLFVSEGFTSKILDMPEEESGELLSFLFAHSTRPEHLYRHEWRPHDMVFWDNRSTVHLAAGCPAHCRRTLYRTTIEGDVPR